MAAAGPDEILVSDLTRALAGASGLAFEDRGTHTFKGLDGEWRLAAFVAEPERIRRERAALSSSPSTPTRRRSSGSPASSSATPRLPGRLRPFHAGGAGAARGDARDGGAASRSCSPPAARRSLKGEELLARVHDLHPHAKRALLIPWGGWADEETADAIRTAMALGHIDYYVLKPWSDARRALPPPRLRVPPGVEARERAGAPRDHGRRRPLVAVRLRASEPARAERRASRVPCARLRRGPAVPPRRAATKAPGCRSCFCRTAPRSSTREPRTSRSTGRA